MALVLLEDRVQEVLEGVDRLPQHVLRVLRRVMRLRHGGELHVIDASARIGILRGQQHETHGHGILPMHAEGLGARTIPTPKA